MQFFRIDFYSDVLKRDENVLVAAPAAPSVDSRVVYLLHGGGGGGGGALLWRLRFLISSGLLSIMIPHFPISS